MDSECAELLPLVCAILADPARAPADDTCLEKLLDWLADLTDHKIPGISLLELNPCLCGFISDMCRSESAEPTIFAFSLKLTGLLASSEQAFHQLKQQGILTQAFEYKEWAESSLWQDATVRSGWIEGLWNMLRHMQAIHFLFENRFIKVILCLQLDRSLFVASAANKLLASILNFPWPSDESPPLGEDCMVDQKDEHKAGQGWDCQVWTAGVMEIVKHVEVSLTSGNPFHTQQSLKLVALSLDQCPSHVRDMLWQGTVGALEALKKNDQNSLVQPFLEALRAAARTSLFSSGSPNMTTLIEDTLCTLNPKVAIVLAKGVIRLENCPQSLKKKAIATILQPLEQIRTLGSPQQKSSGLLKDCDLLHAAWAEDFSQKSAYISVLCLSLSSVAEILLESPCDDICKPSVVLTVIALLNVCGGASFSVSASLPASRATQKLIGCSRVQKCGLDALSSFNKCQGMDPYVSEVFKVVHLYLQNPDSDPVVFQKALQAALNWLHTYSQSSAAGLFLNQDMFLVLKKRFCDVRWEIRDSSLEFFTQLTLHFKDDASYCGTLSSSGIFNFLTALLMDPESYVRASAISALGQTAYIIGREVVTGLQEDLSARFVDILGQDTEGFARRAVLKIFSVWLKHPHQGPRKSLEKHLGVVLQLASNDLDWEVKVYTLELAQILIDQALEPSDQSSCAYACVIPTPCLKRANLTEALQSLDHLRLFDVLFGGLFDCDRPVALKACAVLLNLKRVIMENLVGLDSTVVFDLQGSRWGQEVLKKQLAEHSSSADARVHVNLVELLSTLNLEEMKQTLDQRSDHLENRPRSLLQDILAAAHTTEDNFVDCY